MLGAVEPSTNLSASERTDTDQVPLDEAETDGPDALGEDALSATPQARGSLLHVAGCGGGPRGTGGGGPRPRGEHDQRHTPPQGEPPPHQQPPRDPEQERKPPPHGHAGCY